jgi:hypothetical protein
MGSRIEVDSMTPEIKRFMQHDVEREPLKDDMILLQILRCEQDVRRARSRQHHARLPNRREQGRYALAKSKAHLGVGRQSQDEESGRIEEALQDQVQNGSGESPIFQCRLGERQISIRVKSVRPSISTGPACKIRLALSSAESRFRKNGSNVEGGC